VVLTCKIGYLPNTRKYQFWAELTKNLNRSRTVIKAGLQVSNYGSQIFRNQITGRLVLPVLFKLIGIGDSLILIIFSTISQISTFISFSKTWNWRLFDFHFPKNPEPVVINKNLVPAQDWKNANVERVSALVGKKPGSKNQKGNHFWFSQLEQASQADSGFLVLFRCGTRTGG